MQTARFLSLSHGLTRATKGFPELDNDVSLAKLWLVHVAEEPRARASFLVLDSTDKGPGLHPVAVVQYDRDIWDSREDNESGN